MKKYKSYLLIAMLMVAISGCDSAENEHSKAESEGGHESHEEELQTMHEVYLSELKFNSLGMKLDTMPQRVLSGIVKANGQLEVPPQHEATVTAIVGANVMSIKVIEGDQVSKGQVLAFLSHPDLISLQSNYLESINRLQFLENEMLRQKTLYEQEVGAGKTYQQAKSDYEAMAAQIKGYELQMRQLGINIQSIRNGEIQQSVPVISPISGYIEKVVVQIGQYVSPQSNMFMIVNTEHIHADLMVFEKDVHKITKGQKVRFSVESIPDKQLEAEIYSVGKQFEQNPKAVHVHSEIKHKAEYLIPGMYINGEIQTSGQSVPALPEDAIIEEEGKSYIFTAKTEDQNDQYLFEPIEVRTGISNDGWVEIRLLETLAPGTLIAWNNAYYLISEMKKGATEHSH